MESDSGSFGHAACRESVQGQLMALWGARNARTRRRQTRDSGRRECGRRTGTQEQEQELTEAAPFAVFGVRWVVDCRVGELVPELLVEREEGDLAALEFLPGAVRSTGSAGGRAKALASASQVPGQRRYVEAEAEDVARVERAVAHIAQLM